jgi:hypothetical protein
MPTNEERLARAKEIASSAQVRRIQLDIKLEANKSQQQALRTQFEKLGVTPDELNNKIEELDLQIKRGLDDIEKLYEAGSGGIKGASAGVINRGATSTFNAQPTSNESTLQRSKESNDAIGGELPF